MSSDSMTDEERLQRIVRSATRIAQNVDVPYRGMASDIQRDAEELLKSHRTDTGEQEWISNTAKICRCCSRCWECPCGACLAGGVCDDHRCTCDDPRDEYDGPDDGGDP